MRLDATDLRFVTQEEFRVLAAVEVGSRNHEVVPTPLIAELSSIRSGIVTKCLASLSKRKLVGRIQGAKYDGYRLTYGGLDYLSLRTFSRRKPATVLGVGKKIGVGKESDIYLVKDEAGKERVMKMHRLGRISFRAIKEKRDYLGKRKSASWMYMSRLAAQKEFAFMKVLHESGFPVPVPIDQARHCIIMSLIDAYPMRQIEDVPSPAELFSTLMSLLLRLAHCGLIHGDYNEFNILIHRKTGEPTLIDFPQMVSTRHPNAEFFFDRDVECIKRFFRRRFRFEPTSWPKWKAVLAGTASVEAGSDPTNADTDGKPGESSKSQKSRARWLDYPRLDEEVEASGWNGKEQQSLDEYFASVADIPEGDGQYSSEDDDDDGDDGDYEDDDDDEDEEDHAVGPGDRPEATDQDRHEADEGEAEDESVLATRMAARLEQIRLNRALGNDDDDGLDLEHSPDALPSGGDEDVDDDDDEESGSGSDDDDDDDAEEDISPLSSVPAGRGSQGGKAGSGGKHADRLGKSKLNKREAVASRIEREMAAGSGRGGGRRGTRTPGGGAGAGDGRIKAGKAKGHKWKSSDKYIVGKNSGW